MNKNYKFPSFSTISGTGPNSAIIHYKAALKASPRNFSTLFNLGLAYEENGNIDEAIKNYKQSIINKSKVNNQQKIKR